jgi:hypothetical protein
LTATHDEADPVLRGVRVGVASRVIMPVLAHHVNKFSALDANTQPLINVVWILRFIQ